MALEPAEVVLGLIRAAIPGVRVYDGMPNAQPKDRPSRYVVVYIENPVPGRPSATGRATGRSLSWQVSTFAQATSPGRVEQQARRARATAAAISDYLIEHRLAPASALIQHTSSSWAAPEEPIVARTEVALHDHYEATY